MISRNIQDLTLDYSRLPFDKTQWQTVKHLNKAEEKIMKIKQLLADFKALNRDHRSFICNYFDRIINQVDLIAEEKQVFLRESELTKFKEEQIAVVNILHEFQSDCFEKFEQRENKAELTVKFYFSIQELETEFEYHLLNKFDKPPTGLNINAVTYAYIVGSSFFNLACRITKEFLKAQNILLNGLYIIRPDCSVKSIMQSVYAYQKMLHKSHIPVSIDEKDAEVIYTFEVDNKLSLEDIYKKERINYIFTRSDNSEDAIYLVKLYAVLQIEKPNFSLVLRKYKSLDLYLEDLNTLSIDSRKEKANNDAVLLVLATELGCFDSLPITQLKNLYDRFQFIIDSRHLYTSRVRRHTNAYLGVLENKKLWKLNQLYNPFKFKKEF